LHLLLFLRKFQDRPQPIWKAITCPILQLFKQPTILFSFELWWTRANCCSFYYTLLLLLLSIRQSTPFKSRAHRKQPLSCCIVETNLLRSNHCPILPSYVELKGNGLLWIKLKESIGSKDNPIKTYTLIDLNKVGRI